jgi:hypothetical protein
VDTPAIVINNKEEEEADRVVVENIAISDPRALAGVAIVPATPSPFVPTAGVGVMAFWTTSAAIAAATASYDCENRAIGGVQMSFDRNKDKEVQAQALDIGDTSLAAKVSMWYICEVCGHRYETRFALCRHYVNGHLKTPKIRGIRLFGTKIYIVQF